jgi:hypothetical protein
MREFTYENSKMNAIFMRAEHHQQDTQALLLSSSLLLKQRYIKYSVSSITRSNGGEARIIEKHE